MTALMTVLGIVVFAVGLMVSIAWHELGHLSTAKLFKIRVPQYMVGFGPTVWSRKKGETEYGFKAIPLGGYIRMIGMFPPGEDGRITARSTSPWRSMIEDARSAAYEELQPGDETRLFYTRKPWKRVIVMFAGPFHNLVLAVVFFTLMLTVFGTGVVTTTLRSVPACVLPAGADSKADCTTPVTPSGKLCAAGQTGCALPEASPAAKAGLRPGDKILAVGGKPVDPTAFDSWTVVQDAIRGSAGRPLSLTIERKGQRQDLTVTPIKNTVYTDQTGTQTTTAGYLGVSPLVGFDRQAISEVPAYLGMVVSGSVQKLVQIPERIPQVFRAAFLGAKRDVNGPIGVVGVGRISGEVFALDKVTVLEKVSLFFQMLAGVNLVLFLFNLLPIYPLDGGHVAGALYEKLRATVARVRGRPDPGPFDIARLMPVAYAVAGVFVAFSLLLVVADIVNPITLN